MVATSTFAKASLLHTCRQQQPALDVPKEHGFAWLAYCTVGRPSQATKSCPTSDSSLPHSETTVLCFQYRDFHTGHQKWATQALGQQARSRTPTHAQLASHRPCRYSARPPPAARAARRCRAARRGGASPVASASAATRAVSVSEAGPVEWKVESGLWSMSLLNGPRGVAAAAAWFSQPLRPLCSTACHPHVTTSSIYSTHRTAPCAAGAATAAAGGWRHPRRPHRPASAAAPHQTVHGGGGSALGQASKTRVLAISS